MRVQPRKVIEDNRTYLRRVVRECTYLDLPHDVSQRVQDSLALIDRKLATDQVHLALVGGFSTGKSTLINAILGEDLLTSRLHPTTICPTFISYGDRPTLSLLIRGLPSSQEVVTEVIGELTLEGEFLNGHVILTQVGPGIYGVTLTIKTPGSFSYDIKTQGRTVCSGNVDVWEADREVQFLYSSIANQTATGDDVLFMEGENRPFVQIANVRSKKRVVLNDLFLSGEYGRAVFFEPGIYNVRIECNWDYLRSRYPYRYQRKGWGRLLTRLLGSLGLYRPYTKKIRKVPQPPETSTVKISEPGYYWIGFSPEVGRLVVRPLSELATSRRGFVITSQEQKQAIGPLIAQFTAAPRAKQVNVLDGLIESVRLEYPSNYLRGGLTIIDTPGLNAEEIHSQITVDVIDRIADAAMFLYPADQAGTSYDFHFVREHLEGVSGAILFAVTKADMAEDEEDLQEIVDIIRDKIRAQTGISNPEILALSPLMALREPKSKYGKEFSAVIGSVIDTMTHNREAIMIRHLLKVEHSLMELLSKQASNMEQTFYARLQELNAYTIPDINAFVENEKTPVLRYIAERFDRKAYLQIFYSRLSALATTYKNDISQELAQATSFDELKTICEDTLRRMMNSFRRAVERELADATKEVEKKLNAILPQAFHNFEERFERQYSLKRLAQIEVRVKSSLNVAFGASLLQPALEEIDSALTASESTAGWGVIGGAVVGSAILPGIGTILGGVIGSFLGRFFGPSLEQVRREVQQHIWEHIDRAIYDEVMPEVEKMIDQQQEQLGEAVLRHIAHYVQNYDSQVRELIAEHQRHKREVERYIQEARSIANELKRRQAQLRSLGEAKESLQVQWSRA